MSGHCFSLPFAVSRFALLALVFHSGLGSAAEPPGIVSREFIYNKAPFPECHASTIEETPSGLVAAWFGGTAKSIRMLESGFHATKVANRTSPVEVADGIPGVLGVDGKAQIGTRLGTLSSFNTRTVL